MLSISPSPGLTFEGEGSLWIPISNMNFDHDDPVNMTREQMTRIAIGLRLWLRRAIKRINDLYTKLVVPRVHGVLKIGVFKMSFSVNTYIQGR